MSNMDVYLHEDPKEATIDDFVQQRLHNTLLLIDGEEYARLKVRMTHLQVPPDKQGHIASTKGPYVIVKFD